MIHPLQTMTRGYTEEADRILNYLVTYPHITSRGSTEAMFFFPSQEYGIFDALQKQYLRSFIFAIYLVGHSTDLLYSFDPIFLG
jgi:meiosis-specific protein HOP1